MCILPNKPTVLEHINVLKNTINVITSRSNRYASAENLKSISDATEFLEKFVISIFDESTNHSQSLKLNKIINLLEKPEFPALCQTPTVMSTTVKNQRQEIIIHPQKTVNNDLNSEAILSVVKTQFLTKTTKAKVVKVKKNRTNVSIVCENSDEANKLIGDLSNVDILKSKAKIFAITKQNPSIIIKDIDKMYDDSNLIDDIIEMNQNMSSSKDDYKILFNINKNYGTKDIVLRVSPQVFKSIEKNNYKVFIPGQLCHVTKKILTNQCQNCFIFGHKTKECKKTPICFTCGESKISNSNTPHVCSKIKKCVNCHFYNCKNTTNQKPTDHFPNRKGCSYYDMNVQKIENNINYDV